MKPSSSKPRTADAERLERDYLERLHRALRKLPADEAAEIEENVAEHIHEALAELDSDEVGLSQMASVLEELGSPESLVPEFPREDPVPSWNESSAADDYEALHPPPTLAGDREFLDRLFAGYLIVTIGLFIPFIDFYFCAIIGYTVIWWNLRKAPTAEIAQGKTWSAIAALAAFAMLPAALMTLADKILGILYLPVGLAWGVGDIVLYWIVFGGISNWIDKKGMTVLARKTRTRRIYYIVATVVMIMAIIPLGLIASAENDETFLTILGFAFLPVAWLINWFLILKPLLVIRRNLH